MTEGITAIKLHVKGLVQEYERIKTATRGPEYDRADALELIKKKIIQCEKDISTLELYHQTKKKLGNY
jgi:hypothetical protein